MKKLSLAVLVLLLVSMVTYGEDCWICDEATGYLYAPYSIVGIGTSLPQSTLDVAGTVRMKGFLLPTGATNGHVLTSNSSGWGTWQLPSWTKSGSNIYRTTGRVGIGITSPETRLHVEYSVESQSQYLWRHSVIYGYNTGGYYDPIGIFGRVNASSGKAVYGKNENSNGYGGYFVGKGYFSGNVGIGTTMPSCKLDVLGDINIGNSNVFKFGGGDFIKRWDANKSFAIGKNTGADKSGCVYVGDYAGNGNTRHSVTAIGHHAGRSNTGSSLTALGIEAGNSNTGGFVTVVGDRAGNSNTGNGLTALGTLAGHGNTGNFVTALGHNAGHLNTGPNLTAVGNHAGGSNEGNDVTVVGDGAGTANTGNKSCGFGYYSLSNNTGDNVVAIGYLAGIENSTSNVFILKQNNVNTTPLIYGNFSSGNVGIGTTDPGKKLEVNGDIKIPVNKAIYFGDAKIEGYSDYEDDGLKFYGEVEEDPIVTIDPSGRVGIGTTDFHSRLTVNGAITAEDLTIVSSILPDFVFKDDYKLMSLNEVEQIIKKEKSLPGIPTSDEAAANGIKVGEMQAKLLQKIEELTLYVIDQNKEITELRERISKLEK